ncbi:uncharacterized protein LOC111914437 [Lactuca sativa]|uniref:uncharacterized protein LOC111914437 n=1 Tax=Lactuca sativa TaxID=4236 RepID=UPI000CD900E9|nr:uncharacterized protein LOC111914437 [Lactuca sativa]
MSIFLVEAKTTLTPWAETIIEANKNVCNNWMVYPISNSIFEVKSSTHKSFIVDLQQRTCTCRRWQIDGLPCGHLIKVLTMNRYEDCLEFALNAYFTETLRKTYEEYVNPLPSPYEWEIPDDLMIVKPLIMERRQPGRPRNTGRIPSQCERPI